MKIRERLTFDAEGSTDPGSRYYSRRAHVPSPSSGVTIGRGYDLSLKSPGKAVSDLVAAGMPRAAAELFARATGLRGPQAKAFVAQHKLPEISAQVEIKLFKIALAEKLKEAKRICEDRSVVESYGETNWHALSPLIKELLGDLIYRGDYTSQTRRFIQPSIVSNDLTAFKRVLSNRAVWANVPLDRFLRRVAFLHEQRVDEQHTKDGSKVDN